MTPALLATTAIQAPRTVIIVSYGMGVDSTAMLVGMWQRGIRPDFILFADTGSEKPETYAYLPIINAWLERVGFPLVTVVKNARPKTGDKSLGDACMRNRVLPALAFGQHQCSLVWKRDPQISFLKKQPAVRASIASAVIASAIDAEPMALPTICIGYNAGPRDSARRYSAQGKDTPGFANRFPCVEFGWDRERETQEILAAGLPLPVKSSCFFCPAMKKSEVLELAEKHPELAERGVEMERLARERGLRSCKGLGRSFGWTELLAKKEAA